jgi:hypothetical protein
MRKLLAVLGVVSVLIAGMLSVPRYTNAQEAQEIQVVQTYEQLSNTMVISWTIQVPEDLEAESMHTLAISNNCFQGIALLSRLETTTVSRTLAISDVLNIQSVQHWRLRPYGSFTDTASGSTYGPYCHDEQLVVNSFVVTPSSDSVLIDVHMSNQDGLNKLEVYRSTQHNEIGEIVREFEKNGQGYYNTMDQVDPGTYYYRIRLLRTDGVSFFYGFYAVTDVQVPTALRLAVIKANPLQQDPLIWLAVALVILLYLPLLLYWAVRNRNRKR